jgi:hypothetical protein
MRQKVNGNRFLRDVICKDRGHYLAAAIPQDDDTSSATVATSSRSAIFFDCDVGCSPSAPEMLRRVHDARVALASFAKLA